jgi:hypothetical protein
VKGSKEQREGFTCFPCRKWTPKIHNDHDPDVNFQILLFWVGVAYISCAPALSFQILDKWNINNPCLTSIIKPSYVIVFLNVCSEIVCHG